MKSSTLTGPVLAPALESPGQATLAAKTADFVELTKPRIAVLVLFTVAAGAMLAQPGLPNLARLLHTLLGTALVACGASALNQLLERHSDGLMRRTENRPLPAGRLQPLEVLAFGLVLSLGGLLYLAVALRHPLAVGVAAVTLVSYVVLYTPLKRVSTLNTLVGAVPGALPPVIGWTAMTDSLGGDAVLVFLVLFLWQVPHFLAIAWIYREDYARAGLKMLPGADEPGCMTGRQMLLYCLTLLVVSLWPAVGSNAGWIYAVGTLILGLLFARSALGFYRERTNRQARRVLHASLIYLPAWLALVLIDHWMK